VRPKQSIQSPKLIFFNRQVAWLSRLKARRPSVPGLVSAPSEPHSPGLPLGAVSCAEPP
jgi:hypothetical protein